MKSDISLFPGDLNKDFDPTAFWEERVEPKSFRNVFITTLLWTMGIPLAAMILIHHRFITETNRWVDRQQADFTRVWAYSVEKELTDLRDVAASLAAMPSDMVDRGLAAMAMRGAVGVRVKPASGSMEAFRSAPRADGKGRIFVTGCARERCVELAFEADSIGSAFWERFPTKRMVGYLVDDYGRLLFSSDPAASSRFPDQTFLTKVREGVSYWRTVEPRNVAKILAVSSVEGERLLAVTEYPIYERDALMRRSLSTSGFLILLSVLGSLLAGIWASRSMARSVELLNDGVSSMQSGADVEIAEKIARNNGPTELVKFGERFEAMARENREKSRRLQNMTSELEERVKERTERLHRRNAELRALHLLLAPFRGPVLKSAEYAAERIREVYGLDVLRYVPLGEELASGRIVFPVRLNGTTFGFVEVEGDVDDEVRSAVNLLADSIAIVLSNHQLVVSLTRAQDTLRSALSSMTEGVALVTTDTGRLAYSNRLFKQLFGLSTHTKRSFDAMLRERFVALRRIDEGGRTQSLELGLDALRPEAVYHLTSSEDRGQTLELRTFPIRTGMLAQSGVGLGIVVRDVSEEIQMSRMKERMVSIVAHELKTPITSLRLQAETLASQIGLSEEERDQILADMCEESVRLRKLIDDWLDLARFDEGMLSVDRKVVHIASAIDKAAKLVKARFELTVKRKIAPEAECFMFDIARITQVFINLFSNAARYGRNGVPAVVNVTVWRVDERIRIVVQDNGMGIEPGKLPHIFERFYQADMMDRRRRGGSGLGLAIVKAIVQAHGGTIAVESREGVFTRFTMELPY